MEETKTTPLRHSHFAGRLPCGTEQPVTLTKNGVRHVRRLANGEEKETLAVGLACSECFSGPNLYKLLKPGLDYEAQAMQELMLGHPARPLSNHTSGGVSEALGTFLHTLEPFLPWKHEAVDDYHVSLQLEGASAVSAGIDMLMQVQRLTTGSAKRTLVAVGGTSYHGPPSTSFGAKCPLWNKPYQVLYPGPVAGVPYDEEELMQEYTAFLDQYGTEIAVMLVEPQWGSSQAGMPWPKDLLKTYICMAQSRGILVLADEIMCGLGRHGQGTLFCSEAWDLNPDAITFGKAIGAGVYPLSGAIVKKGRTVLQTNKCSVMQSHTYAGSSVRALLAATAVLQEMPLWLESMTKLGQEMNYIFGYLAKMSKGMVLCHGQGLMWGGIFSRTGQAQDPAFRANMVTVFQKHCEQVGIVPYYVPLGGFMVSPVVDIDVGTIYEIGERFERVLTKTMQEVGWTGTNVEAEETTAVPSKTPTLESKQQQQQQCLPNLHMTRSCTSCSDFVCHTVRTRFVMAA